MDICKWNIFTLQQRFIITVNEDEYINTRKELINILTNKNESTENGIRKCKNLKFDGKHIFIAKYFYAKLD